LSGNVGALSHNISSELAGELGPETQAMLQNTAAQYGVGAGVPLSPFSGASGLRHLGLTAEAQKSRGNADLLSALPTLANTLTVNPQTQLEVANRNATLNAAPDPAAAAAEAQRLFNEYLKKTARGGGVSFGGGGGGAPRNQNAPGSFMSAPWEPASGGGGFGTMPVQAPYTGGLPNFGSQGRAPQQPQGPELGLWGEQGPELGQWGNGAGANDAFDWGQFDTPDKWENW
jgi:hypothetical protein